MVAPQTGTLYRRLVLPTPPFAYDFVRMANASKRRCKATNRRGERCGVTVINAAGYCVAHDPKRPADMRELGKRSAKARRGLNLDRVHPSLREYRAVGKAMSSARATDR